MSTTATIVGLAASALLVGVFVGAHADVDPRGIRRLPSSRRTAQLTALALIGTGVWLIIAAADHAQAAPLEHRDTGGYDYLNYMAAGDSITYGIGTSNPPATSYPERANVRSRGIGGSCLIAHPAADGSGSSCAQIRVWLPDYVDHLPKPPKTIVAMIGTNDYPFSTAADIVAAMKDLRAIMATRGVRVVFGTITPAPAGSYWNIGQSGIAKQTRLAVNDWIRAHDIYRGPEYARALQCGDRDLCPEFVSPMGDVHVNDYAAATMANVLRGWIGTDR